jgi:cysteine desulfurase/selenocysteine lyase
MEPCDWARYRREFPVTRRYVYMNHAAVSPLSTRVMRAMNEIERGFLEKGVLCEKRIFPRVEAVRGAAARLIGARADEIAFTRNTTNGVLIAAGGIRWRRGDNVVIPAIEFPANAYPSRNEVCVSSSSRRATDALRPICSPLRALRGRAP